MGLDWCVKDKIIPEMKESLSFSDVQIDRVKAELEVLWLNFAKASGDPTCMTVFPNQVYDDFTGDAANKPLLEKLDHWLEVRGTCVTSPMETLGAPRIGFDEEATSYARDQYTEAVKTNEKLQAKYPSVEEYLEAEKGLYVPQLVKSEGIASISGIFVGAESFRGKCIARIEWLPDYGFLFDCYEDQSPEELVKMGNSLEEAADRIEAITDNINKDLEEELEVVRDASKWCKFWGRHGHGMSAWY